MSVSTIQTHEPRASARAEIRIPRNAASARAEARIPENAASAGDDTTAHHTDVVSRITLGVRPRSTLPADCIRAFAHTGVGLRSLSICWDRDQPGWQIVTCEVYGCPKPIARQIADRIAESTHRDDDPIVESSNP